MAMPNRCHLCGKPQHGFEAVNAMHERGAKLLALIPSIVMSLRGQRFRVCWVCNNSVVAIMTDAVKGMRAEASRTKILPDLPPEIENPPLETEPPVDTQPSVEDKARFDGDV